MTFDWKMDRGSSYLLLLCLLLVLLSSSLPSSGAQSNSLSDGDALLLFKNFTDGGRVLNMTWVPGTDPCNPTWRGITCSASLGGRVTKVDLSSSQLNGTIPESSLGNLTELKRLNLSNNTFTGSFPSDLSNLNRLVQLWAQNSTFSGSFPNISMTSSRLNKLYLSGNKLSGPIPDLTGLSSLMELDLSFNSFEGPFPFLPSVVASSPSSLSVEDSTLLAGQAVENTQLTKLNLSGNGLSDLIPDLSHVQNLATLDLSHNSFNGSFPLLPSNLSALDLSSNSLTGSVPLDLAKKFPNAFQGDPGLCIPTDNSSCDLAPAPAPGSPKTNDSSSPGPAPRGKNSNITRNAILISLGVVVLILILTGCVVKCFPQYFTKRGKKSDTKKAGPPEKGGDSSAGIGMSSIGGESDRSKLSFIDDSQQGYDLEDLLRASAEMLGKGSFGTAYKAVMESGMIVAVKRLRDVKDIRRNEFSHHMELLGRLKHPNIVPLRAYYYAREEKLLIYDFMPNGSLFSLLHGSRGPGRTPLEWPARLSIAQGVAKGLTYLHKECGHKIPHANIKSSNVLMGKNFEVCISDFGLAPLMPPQIASQRMAGYRAPEYFHAKKITYKADVYSFGVLLLELLTGRQPAKSISDNGLDLPKWVQSVVREEWTGEVFDLELKSYLHGEEEMVTLLQVAMSCVEPKPDERPEMGAVVELLDGIRRGESVIDSESYQSHSTEGDYSSHDLPRSV